MRVHGLTDDDTEFSAPIEADSEEQAELKFLTQVAPDHIEIKDDESTSEYLDRLEAVTGYTVTEIHD